MNDPQAPSTGHEIPTERMFAKCTVSQLFSLTKAFLTYTTDDQTKFHPTPKPPVVTIQHTPNHGQIPVCNPQLRNVVMTQTPVVGGYPLDASICYHFNAKGYKILEIITTKHGTRFVTRWSYHPIYGSIERCITNNASALNFMESDEAFNYDDSGRLTRYLHREGVFASTTQTYKYDARGRIAEWELKNADFPISTPDKLIISARFIYSHCDGALFAVEWVDPDGNVVRRVLLHHDGRVEADLREYTNHTDITTYTYDKQDRILSMDHTRTMRLGGQTIHLYTTTWSYECANPELETSTPSATPSAS